MPELYQSQLRIARDGKSFLVKNLQVFLQKNRTVYCRSLKRSVLLDKLPDAITKRKHDVKKRLQCFVVAIDILQRAPEYTSVYRKGLRCFQVCGLDKDGKEVIAHLREEVTKGKDRVLYLVSTFCKRP